MSILSSRVKADLREIKQDSTKTTDDISKEFKSFLSDLEDWVRTSPSLTGDDLVKARSKLNQRIDSAKEAVGGVSTSISQQAFKTAAATNQYVHKQPWTVLGAGAAISFLLGVLLAPRD